MFAADASTFLTDFGDPLNWTPSTVGNTITGVALFDQGDTGGDGGGHISREYTLTVEAATWPGLKRGELVVVGSTGGGNTYRLRTDLIQGDDAVFSSAKLTRVTP